MAEVEEDKAREHRIAMEIVVDAYDEEERAMGWYYSLDDKLHCPFRARCTMKRRSSPLRVGEEVEVTGMAPEEDCFHEMFVMIPWEGRELAVPLTQLEPIDADAGTREIVADWHYWVARGHQF